MTLKVFESFTGYGSQSIALENIGIDYEVVATSEIDKYAIIAYDALHRHNMNTEVEQKTKEEMVEYLQNKRIAWDSKKEKCMLPKSEKQIRQLYEACVRSKNLGDISNIKVEDIPKHDLFTVSSPCTDFSVAGKTKGAMWTCKKCETKFNPFETNFTSKCPNCGSEEITKTASSLLVECSKIIQYCRPKFIFMENVKNLVGKKFKPFFDKWCEYLESLGYTNYYSVLNGKDFGIPQNRERVFMISIHGEHTPYEFPKGFPLKLRLKDMLEDKVDEKYYLPQEMHDRFLAFPKNRLNNEDLEVIGTTAPNPYDKEGNIIYDKCTSAWCYSPDKCISTLSARDYKQPKQIVESNNDKFVSKKYEEFIDKNGYIPEMFNPYNCKEVTDISPTQTTQCGSTTSSATVLKTETDRVIVEGNASKNPKSQANQVVSDEGISMTLCSGTHGYAMGYVKESKDSAKIIEHKLMQNVKVRKYKVDIEKLKEILKVQKQKLGLTINDISNTLNVNKTTVEHWFRSDDCFSIPDAEIWLDLKKLLQIDTDEFMDKSIMEFEIKPNEYDMTNRVYDENGISPTLTCTGESGAKKVLQYIEELKPIKLNEKENFQFKKSGENIIGELSGELWDSRHEQTRRVYDTNTISPTIPTSQGGGVCPKILVEKLGNIYPSNGQNGNIYSSNGISPTISAGTGIKGNGIGSNNAPKILIDKLNFVGGIGEKDWAGDGKKLSRNYPQGNRVYDENGIACSQTSNGGGLGGPTGLYLTDNKDINPIRLGGVFDDEKSRHQAGSVRDKEQLSPTLDTAQGGYREPCIVEKVQLKNSDIELTQEELPCCVASRGRNVDNPSRRIAGDDLEQRLEPNRNDCTNTLTSVSKDNYVMQRNFRIRRLTCRECFRLMGLKDYQIDLIQNAKISDTQQYKMAGNSIIVDVLEYIFSNLFKGTDL